MGSIRLPNLSIKGVYLYYNNLLNYNLNFWYYFYFFFFLKDIVNSIFLNLDLALINNKTIAYKVKKLNLFSLLTGLPVLILNKNFMIIKINFINYNKNYLIMNKIILNLNLLKNKNIFNLNYKNLI